MTVVITGAGGQLGLDLVDAFADHTVVALDHAALDIADEAAVTAAVRDHAPALVVNAGAWTDVDGCEADPFRAHRVNALGPWWLARAAATTDATLVHVSTDYVFSGPAPTGPGDTRRGWTEFDPIHPANVYGRSKAAGEQLVRASLPAHHLVRTSWVSGARGSNFVRTLLRRADDGHPLRVVDDQTGSPTVTRDLAAAIHELAVTGRYGTVNRTNRGWATRYEVATAIFELIGKAVDLAPRPSTPPAAIPADVPGSEAPAPQTARRDGPTRTAAPRPAWSVLDDTHAVASGLTPLPPWRDGLARLLAELGRMDPGVTRPLPPPERA